ncbi:MAG: flagellar motor switch protein FliG [Thermotogaceae bacterium]|jgi:flagellar motor switch protein FliG|nr:flagellar motor switch protein FliG [Thermotogaceae bacterium]MDN5338174.1 flagellar motor switch protein FliG [Thermotogaceae bacterium]
MAREHSITGKRKAAILLLTLGPEKAAKVLRNMDESEIEELTLELANIGKINEEERKEVLKEFGNLVKAKDFINQGGIAYAKEILEKALGPDKALEIIDRLTSNLQVKPFEFIKKADPVQLVSMLQNEHPQTIALVVCYLDPKTASAIIRALPENLRPEVIKRIALLDRATPEIVREVERVLERKVSAFATAQFSQVGGLETVVDIMNTIDRTTEREILEKLGEQDPELAEEIRKHLFVFEDLVKLDDRSIQIILREVDTRDLALALKGATDELKEKIFRNMSKRAASLLKDELDYMGPVRVKDVEGAQQKIVEVVRRLEEAGEIVIARGGGEELIV